MAPSLPPPEHAIPPGAAVQKKISPVAARF